MIKKELAQKLPHVVFTKIKKLRKVELNMPLLEYSYEVEFFNGRRVKNRGDEDLFLAECNLVYDLETLEK